MKATIELRCSRPDLARWLGAVTPETMAEHKELRRRGDLVVRCTYAGIDPMFWAWVVDPITARSS
jgi:hypothetical protein